MKALVQSPEDRLLPTEQGQQPAGQLPVFEPLMLSGLTYSEAKAAARETGCALRRPHWCNLVLIWDHGRLWFEDEGIVIAWGTAPEDMAADDWMMVERPEASS